MTDSNPSTQIRLVRRREDAQLRQVRLNALSYAPYLAKHLKRERAAPSNFWRERAERGAAGANMATFVAVEGSEFVGIVDVFVSENGDVAEIGGMWVERTFRRSGIGQELLDAAVDWARDRGARRAGLWVREANTAARLLYERRGFELSSTSKVAGETGLRLERHL